MGFKISSFNVRGLNSPQKRSMLWKEARLLQSDILCLQETHFSASKPPKFSHQNFPTIICSNAPKKKRGVAILIKDTISFRQIYKDVDVMGRYIILVGEALAENKGSRAVMSLDIAKTFDSLEWGYLWELHKYVKNVHYTNPDSSEIYFNERREITTNLNFQSWSMFKNKYYSYRTISTIQSPDYVLEPFPNMSDPSFWKGGKIPVSRCSDPCLPGSRKKFGSSFHKCCYECVSCPEGEISNISDSENCMKCPDDEWLNEKKDRCVPRVVEFLSYTDDTIVALFSAVSIFCCLLTGLILAIFIHYQDTPIVKANNRDLSYLLLVSIMLSFLCVFLFLGHPVDVTCMFRVTTFGVFFSVAISSLLAKSIMVCIAFKATKPGSTWRKWMGSKLPSFIICVFSLVQVIICVTWLSISPPFQDQDTHSYQGKIIIQCNEGSVISFYSVLGYMGLLAAVSFNIAFLARKLPDNFNEAQYITFSMLVFCSVWISMIPAYLSTRGKYMVAVEVFAIIASSSGLLCCIFFPKCYIILFRPDLNTKIVIR
ncbi:vomeronasal type-2 receptor 26-like [Aquarana catesbeiana]|uniref:vomeronasal type-2 receptor 26-like n=1 Tax=Aquarana catesbeiana TaxID=8400 RepID=UPI003CC9678C